MINGFLKEVPKSMLWESIIVEPSKWFNMNEADAIRKIRMFYKKFKIINKKGKRLGKKNRQQFSLFKMAKEFNSILDKALDTIPSPVTLKLPKLKKVGGGNDKSKSLQTIKLPKLKKVT